MQSKSLETTKKETHRVYNRKNQMVLETQNRKKAWALTLKLQDAGAAKGMSRPEAAHMTSEAYKA